eukprot:6078817-Prymnesium_polylepis.3
MQQRTEALHRNWTPHRASVMKHLLQVLGAVRAVALPFHVLDDCHHRLDQIPHVRTGELIHVQVTVPDALEGNAALANRILHGNDDADRQHVHSIATLSLRHAFLTLLLCDCAREDRLEKFHLPSRWGGG